MDIYEVSATLYALGIYSVVNPPNYAGFIEIHIPVEYDNTRCFYLPIGAFIFKDQIKIAKPNGTYVEVSYNDLIYFYFYQDGDFMMNIKNTNFTNSVDLWIDFPEHENRAIIINDTVFDYDDITGVTVRKLVDIIVECHKDLFVKE